MNDKVVVADLVLEVEFDDLSKTGSKQKLKSPPIRMFLCPPDTLRKIS